MKLNLKIFYYLSLERCHARGIPAGIVYAAGFAEAPGEGEALQRTLEAFVQRSGMVVAGPNCMGFANLNLHAYTAFASVFKNVPPQTGPGRASIVTQSGNVCSAVFSSRCTSMMSGFISGWKDINQYDCNPNKSIVPCTCWT